jgi:hypothetical protein
MIIARVATFFQNCPEKVTSAAETAKNWAEAFAWLCAGGFFVYKAFSGYLISNLSLSLKCQRRHTGRGTDYLVVTARLKKGDRGAVSLHDIRAHVSPTVEGESDFQSLVGINRLSSRDVGNGIWNVLKTQSREAPLLNLPPEDETSFSQCFVVPSDLPCAVDVTVLGGWSWHRKTRYQWRASAISLPNDEISPS